MRRIALFLMSISFFGVCFAYPGKFTGFYVGVNGGVNQFYGTTQAQANIDPIHTGDNRVIVTTLSNGLHADPDSLAVLGVIDLGYGYQLPCYNLYLGLEGFVSFVGRSDSASDFSSTTLGPDIAALPPFVTATLNTVTKTRVNPIEWGIDLKPGFTVNNGDTLLYGRIGASFNQLKIKNSNNLFLTYPLAGFAPLGSSLNTSRNSTVTGFRLGVGAEEYLCNCFAVNIDYIYTWYGSVRTNGVGDVSSDVIGPVTITDAGAFTSSAYSHRNNQELYIGLKYYFF